MKEDYFTSNWYMIEKYEKGKWVKLDKKKEIDKILDLNKKSKTVELNLEGKYVEIQEK